MATVINLTEGRIAYIYQDGENVLCSTNLDDTVIPVFFPIAINNLSDGFATVNISELTLTDVNSYIVINSSKININGTDVIAIENVSNYGGFIHMLASITDINITNINIISSMSSLSNYCGWVVTSDIESNVNDSTITYCSSNGYVPNYGGGITGGYNRFTVSKCFSTGSMGDENSNAGSICGYANSGNITNCYSLGIVGGYGGGICGGVNSGNISTCYSLGDIYEYGGGIVGVNNVGNITNCYSAGDVSANAGSIAAGNNAGNISHCYSSGAGAFNFYGDTENAFNITDCYSEAVHDDTPSWNNTHADSVLQTGYYPITIDEVQKPYLLTAFQYYEFDPTSVTLDWSDSNYGANLPTFNSTMYPNKVSTVANVETSIVNVSDTTGSVFIEDNTVNINIADYDNATQTITILILTTGNNTFPYNPYNFATFEFNLQATTTDENVGQCYHIGRYIVTINGDIILFNKKTAYLLLTNAAGYVPI